MRLPAAGMRGSVSGMEAYGQQVPGVSETLFVVLF